MGARTRAGILISGFYGFGNLGDEAVLAGMIQSLRARLGDVPMTVLSADPNATEAAHGVRAVGRTDPGAIIGAMRRARLFLSGGGSLLQDTTSARSALYYLGLLRLARALVPRTMVYASGIGPLRRPLIQELTGRVLSGTDAVTVRDEYSATLVQVLTPRVSLIPSADPAVVLQPVETPRTVALVGDIPPGPLIGAVVRPWGDSAFVDALSVALQRAAHSLGAGIVVIPFYPAVDLPVSRRLAAASGGSLIAADLRPAEVMALIGRMAVLVGVRLHALLFAAAMGVPPVGLNYDPKVPSLFHDLRIGAPLPLDVDPGCMADAVTQAWDRREALRSRLAAGVARLRARAEVAAEVAARLYAEAEALR